MSAVSGGSYALSWFLLQPFYHRSRLNDPGFAIRQVQEEMFDLNGPFQRYLSDNAKPVEAMGLIDLFMKAALSLTFDLVFFNALRVLSEVLIGGTGTARFANLLNAQSVARKNYRMGIQRTYHVFPDPQKKMPVEKISFSDRTFIAGEYLDLTRSS